MKCNTLVEALRNRAHLDQVGVTFIESSSREVFLSYKALYAAALSTLTVLQDAGIQPKDELVLQVEDNKTSIILFWACLIGGIVPVPLTVGQNEEHKKKLFHVWPVLNRPFLAISASNLEKIDAFAQEMGLQNMYGQMVQNCIDVHHLAGKQMEPQYHEVAEGDIAFIQFSSGSTGSPKGVMLTHRNLIANIDAISKAACYTEQDSMLSWMPLTHDMGMIGFHLNPLYCGMNQYLIPTQSFVRRPSIWLDKASEHKISILCSPNFGYQYLIKHCSDAGKDKWDLSSVRILYNGAEPVSATLCHEFISQFSKCGLSSKAMCPVYGLAEASLAVSISGLKDEVTTITIDRNGLNPGCKIVEKTGGGAIELVNVGRCINDCSIRVADESDNVLPECTIGFIQIKGNNVTKGYYNNEDATDSILSDDGWMKTGDIGLLKEGCLYITGRAKDIIFVNGQNFYSNDLEQLAQEVGGIELNKVAIAGCFNSETQQEEVIAFVFHRGSVDDFVPVAVSLKSCISSKVGIQLNLVLPAKDIPRTTSGKLQRFKLLERLRAGDFEDTISRLKLLLGERPVEGGRADGDEQEEKMLEIWEKVLGINNIRSDQSFFEIGGNSLKSAEVIMLVWKEYDVELPMSALYENATIRKLTKQIKSLDKHRYLPIPTAIKRDTYPVTASQKRIYYFQALHQQSTAYNIPVAFKLTGQIDEPKLTACIRLVLSWHDAYRMTFHLDGEPVFVVQDEVSLVVEKIRCAPDRVTETLVSLVKPFDLATGPLYRFRLLYIREDEYILYCDFHHIITDGVSVYHFMTELLNLYHGNELTERPTQYADYTDWIKGNNPFSKAEGQKTFWLSQLEGSLPKLEMPLDFHRPALFDTGGGKMEYLLPSSTTMQLNRLARESQVSLHVLMFTLYNVLLSKYTGQKELLVGIPVAVRTHPDLQQMHGMLVNNLAIRSSIDPGETFIQLLARLQENMKTVLYNKEYPFDELILQAGIKHTVDRNPLFDTMFIYQDMGIPSINNADLQVERCFFDAGFSKFDISMEVFDDGDTLHYAIEYAARLFKAATIRKLATHFNNLIYQVIHEPNRRIADLSLMTNGEYNEYVVAFNATQKSYPSYKTIHRLIEEQVAKTPDRIALEYQGEKISYQQLDDMANQLAVLLQGKGVAAGTVTGILLPRSPWLIISILAVLKAGGCYLPIDTNLPDERIGLLVQDSQCSVMISDNNGIAGKGLRQLLTGVQLVDIDKPDLLDGVLNVFHSEANEQDLAYIIYTSGTTGKPKGVMISHRSLVNYCCWAAESYIKGEEIAFPLFTSISFDLTVTSVFTPLITGNKIVIYEDDDAVLLIDKIISDNKADVVKLTPSHLKIIGERKLLTPHSKLKRFVVGGEELTTQLAKDIHDQMGGNVEIYNEYGPTEATVGCMIHKYDPAEVCRTVPIGVPASNTKVYILDKHLAPVAAGIYGELYIGGDGVAKGYLFNEILTGQKFIPNPFVPGEKLYRTGDIGRMLPEGVVAFAGRYDQQVKINGYRIELLEIETHLRSFPGIEDALVIVRADKGASQQLSAFYKAPTVISDAAMRNFLAGRLPHYMIPVYFTKLEEIPLTVNGKVAIEALPALGENSGDEVELMPLNEIEMLSLEIWKDVLGQENLFITDNFFELGGDSIKAVQIASRLLEKRIALPVKDILTYQTIQQASIRASKAGENKYEQGVVSGEKALSPIDAWFFSKGFANPGYYNQSVLLRLNKNISVEKLEKAFAFLVQQHDGLRLNYNVQTNRLFYNNGHLAKGFTISIHETSSGSEFVETCVRVKSGFNLEDSLLLKAAVISDVDNGQMMLITAHHLLVDGVSWRVLLDDLYLVYTALEKKQAFSFPAKTASLLDWGKKLQEYAVALRDNGVMDYWKDSDAFDFKLPQDFETDDWRALNAGTVTGYLNKQKTDYLLKEANKIYNTNVLMLLNTALVLTFQGWTGMNEFVVEQENHGRHWDDLNTAKTLGWFTTLYPVKLALGEGSIADQVKAVKEQMRTVPDQGLGYGIYKYLEGRPYDLHQKLTAARFNYLGQFDKELNNDLFTYSAISTGGDCDPENTMTAKLEFNSMVIDGRFKLVVTYNQKAHSESFINWLKDTFFNNLDLILDHIAGEERVHFTPSDFNAVELDQEELDSLFK